MKMIKARTAGFCMGVDRALRIALDQAGKAHPPVSTYGALIHNPQVVEQLQRKGVEILSLRPGEKQSGTVVLRAHGVSPSVKKQLEDSGLVVIDATCPHVVRIHKLIQRHLDAGGDLIVIIGDRDHAEVTALLGHAGAAGHAVETVEDVAQLPEAERVCVVSQTTQSRGHYEKLLDSILERWPDARAHCTICDATDARQRETVEIARQVDVMIVVGGYNSANTVRLAELAAETGTETHHIESAEELQPEWFREASVAGLSAGASTPPEVIETVENMIRKISGA